jgi:preprotein translocase subunit SecB
MAIPLQLERYFFPVQRVEANPDHNPNEPIDIKSKVDFNIGEVPEQKGLYAVELTLNSTVESINPSYTYTIVGFALLRASDQTLPESDLKAAAASLGTNLLVGVARERLNDLTARGPWPTVTLNFVPVLFTPEQQVEKAKKSTSKKRARLN